MPKKSLLTLLFTVCLIFTLAFSAFASGFSDTQGHWAEKEINNWAEQGLASGYSDGTFKPNGNVTRAEFVALVNRAFNVDKQFKKTCGFSDVDSGAWYYNDVCGARAAGYTGGYEDGTFRPQNTITRQEVAGILTRLLNLKQSTGGIADLKDAAQIPQWSRGSIGAVVAVNLMGGFPDKTFQPLKSITRAEAVVSLDRALKYKSDTPPVVTEPEVKTAIQGTVTLNGKAVKGAVVRIFAAGSYKVLKEIDANDSGYFNVELDPGDYDVTAVTDKEVGFKSDVKVTEKNVATADIELHAAAVISGTLEDENGEPVKNTPVFFTTNPTFMTTTDDKGKYMLPVVPNRTYTVRTSGAGGEDDVEPEVVTEEMKITGAGEHTVKALKISTPDKKSAPDDGDTTRPEITGATITVDGNTVNAKITGGVNGIIDLSHESRDSHITGGSLTVSEDATINLELTSIPQAYRDKIGSTTKDLAKGEPTPIKTLEEIGELVDLGTLAAIFGASMTMGGTLEDTAGNVSDVSLTIYLPQ